MSGCIYGPFIDAYDPPVSCAIEMYEHGQAGADGPKAWVYRDNAEVDVTGPIEDLGPVDLDVAIYTVDCAGNPISENYVTDTYHHYRFTLSGALAGEALWIDGVQSGSVKATGECPVQPMPVPQPTCSGMYDWSTCGGGADGGIDPVSPPDPSGDHDFHDLFRGCNAGGGSAGLVVALALLAVRRRTRK